MKNQIIALHIEIKRTTNQPNPFYFNDTMLQALSSGLRSVYEEVFIWSMDKYLAIWVVGNSPEILVNALAHHSLFYKRTSLVYSLRAIDLMQKIAEGKWWNKYSLVSKLETFENGLSLTNTMESIGSVLTPIINRVMNYYSVAPEVKGYSNAWTGNEDKVVELKNTIEFSPHRLYKLSVN